MIGVNRLVLSVFLVTAIGITGFCDVIVPPVIVPGSDDIFLSKLIVFLETISDFGDSDLEIELIGKLPTVLADEAVDFHLVDEHQDSYSVLYRNKGVASYRRAAVSVKRITHQETVSGDNGENRLNTVTGSLFIEKGQMITVSFISGAIRLDVEGKAVESGHSKEAIRVQVIESGKEFIGTVAGPLEVRVDL